MSLSRFLPLTLRRHLADSRDLEEPLYLDGATLFADISGFTPLSEALARMGREGTETLTRTLNGYFTAVIAAIESNGGDVMRFAGDAVTAFFSDPGGQERALTAAHAIQAFMGSHPETVSPVGSFPIRIKVGIAAGEHVLLTVGEGRARDYVFAGHPVDGSAEAEHHAGPAEIVVKARHFKVQGSKFKVEAVKPGFWRVLDLPPSAFSLPPSAFRLQPPASETACAPFLHPILVERLGQGSERMMNEHRRAAVLFVSFPGFDDYRDRTAVSRLRAFYAEARAAVDRHEGNLNKVDMGDKGSKFLITFGAPLSHEDDADRAVHFALDLKAMAGARGLSLAIGLNRGTIFAGLIGDDRRCEYTVMGDEVNLAARLMQSAGPGRILAGPGVHAECRAFAFDTLPPVTLKGKSQPVPVFEPQSTETGEKAGTESFVGRVPELNACEAFLRQAGDDPRLLLVKGEAGIGKSAFLSHLFRERLSDRRIVSGWCREFTSQFPYHPWKFILRRLLELGAPEGTDPAEAWRASLQATVPELVPFAPILLDLLQLPHTLPPVAIDEQTRKAILHRQAGLLVRAAAGREALALSLTDVQWMDPESGGLLADLLRTSDKPSPVFVLSGRELPGGLQEMASSHSLTLGPLPEPDLKKSALGFLRVQRAPDKLLADASAASGGNPLLLQETLRAYLEAGYVTRDAQSPELLFLDETRRPSLPTTLEGVVMARFDRLPADRQAILKALSVFGDSIPWEVARRAAIDTGNDPALLEALFDDGEFITRQGPENFCTFPQSHVRSTIYDSLDFNSRRDLHVLAAGIFRDALPTEAPETIQTVAFHFLLANAISEGAKFILKAAQLLSESNALPASYQHYKALLDARTAIPPEMLLETITQTGILLIKLGRFADALTIFNQKFLDEMPNTKAKAECCVILADAHRFTGNFQIAEKYLDLAMKASLDQAQSFRILAIRGSMYAQMSRFPAALAIFDEIESRFSGVRFRAQRVQMCWVKGPLLFVTGRAQDALHYLRAMQTEATRMKDYFTLVKILHNTAAFYFQLSQHPKAYRIYKNSLKVQEVYGINQIYLMTINEVAFEAMLLGDWREAAFRLTYGYALAEKTKDPIMIRLLCNIAEYSQNIGNIHFARICLGKARVLSNSFGIESHRVTYYWAELLAGINHGQGLNRILNRLEKEIEIEKAGYLRLWLNAYRAYALMMLGNLEEAKHLATNTLLAVGQQQLPKEEYICRKVLFLASDNVQERLGIAPTLLQSARNAQERRLIIEATLFCMECAYDSRLAEQARRMLAKTPFARLQAKYHSLRALELAKFGEERKAIKAAVKARNCMSVFNDSMPTSSEKYLMSETFRKDFDDLSSRWRLPEPQKGTQRYDIPSYLLQLIK